MTSSQIENVTREMEAMAILNRIHRNGPVTCERIDCRRRRRDGSMLRFHRIVWYINGNRVSRKDAANFLAS